MKINNNYKALTYFIALVWSVNGLLCKVLNLVSRHQDIVARILDTNYSRTITIAIGILETIMALWILSNYKSKLNAIVQIIIIATMNVLELILAPDLLLWGTYNSLFAFLFILLVYFTNFKQNKKHVLFS
ncbi:DoxX-like family protein [Lacinutrix gracilariae]|uniref:DoxX-like family protein n=1 Tax=Lacinutrix gracilariae TaxID=1747198 RepID=A0ABW5K4J9_9FLAO